MGNGIVNNFFIVLCIQRGFFLNWESNQEKTLPTTRSGTCITLSLYINYKWKSPVSWWHQDVLQHVTRSKLPDDNKALKGKWKRISAWDLQKGERVLVEPKTTAVSGKGQDGMGPPIGEMAHGEGCDQLSWGKGEWRGPLSISTSAQMLQNHQYPCRKTNTSLETKGALTET